MKKIDEDGEDDDEIWMNNVVERYENRPSTNEFNNICLVEFCSDYRVLARSQIPNETNKQECF